jgi:hypothetical protein
MVGAEPHGLSLALRKIAPRTAQGSRKDRGNPYSIPRDCGVCAALVKHEATLVYLAVTRSTNALHNSAGFQSKGAWLEYIAVGSARGIAPGSSKGAEFQTEQGIAALAPISSSV